MVILEEIIQDLLAMGDLVELLMVTHLIPEVQEIREILIQVFMVGLVVLAAAAALAEAVLVIVVPMEVPVVVVV